MAGNQLLDTNCLNRLEPVTAGFKQLTKQNDNWKTQVLEFKDDRRPLFSIPGHCPSLPQRVCRLWFHDFIITHCGFWNNNRYILSFTNAFSKYKELVAISDRTPETVAKAIFTRWICRYEVQTKIFTNQEKNVCNKVTVELYKWLQSPDVSFRIFISKKKWQIKKLTTI